MKKILLGTTAILGATLLSSGAFAQTVDVKIGGFADFQAAFFDTDGDLDNNAATTASNTEREFRNDVEVWVQPTFKADNGLTYGAYIEIESTKDAATASALDYDEANIFVQGAFGRVELGDQDGASDKLAVYAPTVGLGQFDGDYDEYLLSNLRAPGDTYKVKDSSDASKITYYTPVFAGFQAGVSYAPESDQGDSVVRAEPTSGFSDWIEGAIAYTGDFSGVGVKAGAGVSTAESNVPTVEDFTSWSLGAQVSYAGIAVGGSYVDWDKADGVDYAWTAGVSYTTGPIAVAASYYDTKYISTNAKDDVQAYGVGGAYTVAQGLAVRADYLHVDLNNRATADVESDIFILSTRLSF